MRTLFIFLFFVAATHARSQNQKAEDFCQYQGQSIQKLLANLKTSVADTRIGRTKSGTARNLLLVFNDSSYFEIFPALDKTNSAEKFNLKNYRNYTIKCLFYHVPGEVVDPCGCKSFAPSVGRVPVVDNNNKSS